MNPHQTSRSIPESNLDLPAPPHHEASWFPAGALRRCADSDLWRGLQLWQLWGALGWLEVRQRYRRSVIGPFWITLSLGIIVAGLGIIYSRLFKQDIQDYIPFLAVGMIAWTLISGLIAESCTVFISAEGTIKQLPVPLSIYVYRLVWRHLIILAHNLVIYLAVIAFFRINPGFAPLMMLPGILILALNGVAFGLTLGILSTRFRDIPPIITNAVQLVFFITPILWKPTLLSTDLWVVYLNPFYHLVEIVRQPLLGHLPGPGSWLFVLGFTAANAALAVALFKKARWRIAYWL